MRSSTVDIRQMPFSAARDCVANPRRTAIVERSGMTQFIETQAGFLRGLALHEEAAALTARADHSLEPASDSAFPMAPSVTPGTPWIRLQPSHARQKARLRCLSIEDAVLSEHDRAARDEFHLAAIVQNLKTLALRVLRPPHLPGVA